MRVFHAGWSRYATSGHADGLFPHVGSPEVARNLSHGEDEPSAANREADLEAAQRDDERELVFAVLERYPNAHSLRVAKAAAEEPKLKERAARVAEAIEQGSPGN